MESEISAILISQDVDLIILATQNLQVSFIKFMKNQHNLDLKLIELINLVDYSQISEPLEQSVVSAIRIIHNEQHGIYYLILTTNKGIIINLDITHLILKHYNITAVLPAKESVNILRNQREDYENSVSQHGRKNSLSNLK